MVLALFLLGLLPVVFLPEADAGVDVADDGPEGESGTGTDRVTNLTEVLDDEPLVPVVEDDVVTTQASADGQGLSPDLGDDVVLLPVEEDDPGPHNPGQDGEVALMPMIEDDTAGSTPAIADPNDVLAPIIEDDVAETTENETTLNPLLEDDSNAPGNTAAIRIATEVAPAVIDDFDPTSDVLVVSLAAEYFDGPLEIHTEISENGQDTLVFVDGKPIAAINSASGINESHVYLYAGSGASL